MKRQRVKFLWDLYWENKTCKPKGSIASTSECIWIRHLILKCILTNFYNKAAERVNLLRHPFRIVTFRPQRIYQLMIRPQPVGTLPVPTNLSVMAMVFERIVYDQLYAYLEEHNIICKYQSGFRAIHSTVTALLEATDTWAYNIDRGKINAVVFLDLKKAFDTVDHEILLSKLSNFAIYGNAHQWFKSYLENRNPSTDRCLKAVY